MTVYLFRPRQRGQSHRINEGKVILRRSGPVHELYMSSCDMIFLAYLNYLASYDGVFHIERHGATAGITTKNFNDPFYILQIIREHTVFFSLFRKLTPLSRNPK